MRSHLWLLPAAALALALAPAARAADDAQDTLKKLAGTWKATKIVNDGHEGDAEELKSVQLVIKADGAYTLRQPEGEITGKLTVDPAKTPAEMDASYDAPDGASGTAECIYKLEGDTLTVCWSQAGSRPDEFEAESGSGRRLMVMKRAED